MVDWAPFVELVGRHRRFLLTTHIRPDGDGLGSALALADVLERRGKEARLVVASTVPPRYNFLDPEGRIGHFRAPGETYRGAEALIVLDTGTWNQLGDMAAFVREFPGAKAVIDHHPTQDDLGALRLVDTTAEATGRLVYEAIRALGDPLSEAAAGYLFVALAMDTGWFRHANTTAATFELAGRLVEAGAQPTPVYDLLFEQNRPEGLKLRGLVLQRLRVVEAGRVAYSHIELADYAATGALPQDTEDLVNYPRSVAGVEVGLLFMEQPRGGVKVSFRSRGADVGRVAERFGGGGHRLASGAVLDVPLAEAVARVLEAIRSALTAAG
jgi:phosphoesterase RecJ-like protein